MSPDDALAASAHVAAAAKDGGIVFDILRIVLLGVVFLPFAAISAWSGRLWTVALPVVFWGALAWLQSLGILHMFSGSGAGILAVGGVVIAVLGLRAHPQLQARLLTAGFSRLPR